MTSKLVRRTALIGLLLPSIYFGAASATFLYRVHADNSARASVPLSTSPEPTAKSRILVFAPHCDDETLGCGGLLQKAIKAGARARVVMLTNGDGFRVAVERQVRSVKLTPDDYVRFAATRQEESYRALGRLGVARDDIVFLGYPDRGLMALWNSNWAADQPYRSGYTAACASPYKLAYRRGAVYCGEELLADISRVLRQSRPTAVYVTHPSDDHPDHSAASSFVSLALQCALDAGESWARSCRVHYYLVHRGDWPAPQGLQKSDQLVPPSEMAALDTKWSALPLEPAEVNAKERSILCYPSQTAVMKRFLISFARSSELFGELGRSVAPRVADGAIRLDGSVGDWSAIKPAIQDPVNDNLLRDFQAAGDVKAVYACRDARYLYLRIDTNQALSNRVLFRLRIRFFGDDAENQAGGSFTGTVRPNAASTPSDVQSCAVENRLEVAIPLRNLDYAHRIALNVDTEFAGLQVDRTGSRFIFLEP